ncbi:MAG TPA: PQQ-binding-like beta-propeller repeat protein [Gemmataceae bacterium]|nr:PQQ-binding-like beta-propeller repeat protein [Gemmataceae bacterium]
MCVALLSSLILHPSSFAFASDWPAFLGPTGNSVSPEKGLKTPWPKEGPKILWQRELGIGYAMPTISRGKLYHVERVGDTVRIICMTADTGKELWTFEYPTDYRDRYNYNGGPRGCPIVDGDLVFVHGVEGMLHCLNAENGKLVWKLDTKKEFGFAQNFFGVGSTPVVEKDLLIVQIGGQPPGADVTDFRKAANMGTGVVAFEKTTGKIRYKVGDELASYSTPTLATIHGRRWCFVFARGGLLAFDPATGKEDFHYPWRADILESVNASDPVVIGDRVFISETYGPGSSLLRVKSGGYDVLWSDADKTIRNKSMQCHWNTPIEADGYLYGCSGRHDSNAELRCIELATGKVQWSVPSLTRSSLLMVDGHFICLSEDGVLRLLRVNPKKFDVVSEIEFLDRKENPLLRSPCWAAPILANGRLYIRGDNRLLCLEAMR